MPKSQVVMLLSDAQRGVAERVVGEEQARRQHVVIALSGAHAYGFPSPDSDLDLKSIHLEETRALLGLSVAEAAFDRLEVIDGVEIDYTSNELGAVVAGILAGNGNYIERVLGQLILHTSPEHEQLKELMPCALSRRVYRHYRGFAANQRQGFEAAAQPTAKKLLYVLRTALTGVHLLRTGELRVDLTTTADEYGYSDAHALIAAKRAGEQTLLAGGERDAWLTRLDGLFALLDESYERSVLPDAPAAPERLDAWLISARLAALSPP